MKIYKVQILIGAERSYSKRFYANNVYEALDKAKKSQEEIVLKENWENKEPYFIGVTYLFDTDEINA